MPGHKQYCILIIIKGDLKLCKFKLLFCAVSVALIGLVAMPPGALANDNIYIKNQNTTFDVTDILLDLDVVALAAPTSGLRSGMTVLKHKHGYSYSCTPAMSWIGEGGDASASSKPRSLI